MEYNLNDFPTEGVIDIDGHQLHRSVFNTAWLQDPKVIVDVGAWDFGDSIRLKRAFPNAKVIACEMLPSNYYRFAPFAIQNGVDVINCAVTNKNGPVEFYEGKHIHGDNAQSSLLEPADSYKYLYGGIVTHTKSSSTAVGFTLDSVAEISGVESIDFLHIDVEGAEYQVFEGMQNIKPKMIFAEFLIDGGWKGQKSFNETYELLFSMGYTLAASLGHDRLFVLNT
jgi:FkbM family methyltransferase